jgi:phosphate transport system substrate-binding protein
MRAVREGGISLMIRSRAAIRLVALSLAVAASAAACGGDGGDSGSDAGASEDLTGSIVVSGSSTVEPISAANAQKFSSLNPNVEISVEGPGTGDGFELFCQGETDISDASRAIEEEEAQACKKAGIEYIELKIGIDGITVMTNPANGDVTCLDFHDLYALLGPESEGFENWSDANDLAEEVGAGHAPYPNAPLEITAPGEESGTYDSFGELVLEDIAYEERGIKEDDPVIRPDYQSSGNDNVIIQGVEGADSSLGWVGFAYYEQNAEGVKALEVAAEDECVAPSVETIQSGEYPISRPLFFYVNAAEAEGNPSLAAFVDFYLSADGLASVSEVGYVDQPEDVIAETLGAWENRETGSREG